MKENTGSKFAISNNEIRRVVNSLKSVKGPIVMAISGFVESCLATKVIEAIRKSFDETGFPNNITLWFAAGMGNKADEEGGLNMLAVEGLLTHLVAGHIGLVPKIQKMIRDGKLSAHILPQDVILRAMSCAANGQPYTFFQIGIDTFVDPRLGNDHMVNTEIPLVSFVEIDGEDWLRIPSPKLNVAIIRGASFTETGALIVKGEPLKVETKDIALAVVRNRGVVIAQAKRVVGKWNPADVHISKMAIDHWVVDPDQQMSFRIDDARMVEYDPKYEIVEKKADESMPIVLQIIGQTCASMLEPGTINTGIGKVSEAWQGFATEVGISDKLIVSKEPGSVGGVDSGTFGPQFNPEELNEHPDMFHMYTSKLKQTVMSCLQIDEKGLNVHRLGKIFPGPGGFMGITCLARKAFFCMPFTAKGLEVEIRDGKLVITQEGSVKKFVRKTEQRTYSFKQANNDAREAIIITERCIMELQLDGVLEVIAVMPGINPELHILPFVEFPIRIRKNYRVIDLPIFNKKSVAA